MVSELEFTDRISGMGEALLQHACRLFQTSPDQLEALSGGHSTQVYRFPIGATSRHGVLRIGVNDCPVEQTAGRLEWVRFLSEQGAPVVAPLISMHGRLAEMLDEAGETYIVTAFEEARGILAERIPPSQWTDELFQSIGRAAGRMHAVSAQYQPSHPGLAAPMWYVSFEIHDAIGRFTRSGDPTLEKLSRLVHELRQLPTPLESFGLIHDDLHFANFLVQPDGYIRIIDFDDCVQGWFAMDIAMALFDVLVLYPAHSQEESQEFARRFMHNYVNGYRQEKSLDPFAQQQIPNFLKLKEMCVYAPLVGHADIQQPDSWVGRFMSDRAERIANDEPYVMLDFSSV